jgi:hypothetical protein
MPAWLRQHAAPFRFRVIADGEGFPVMPGRLGQVEWRDAQLLAVYTDRPLMFKKLWGDPWRCAPPDGRQGDAGPLPARGVAGSGRGGPAAPPAEFVGLSGEPCQPSIESDFPAPGRDFATDPICPPPLRA